MENHRTSIYFYVLLFLASFLSACAEVPYTERKQIMMLSEEQEGEIGEKTFEQIKEEVRLSQDPYINRLVREVGERIARASEKTDYDWEFIVIEDRTVNAFALPGGKVAMYTGIMPISRDEAGIAVVMGHEVAHVLARHGAERMSQEQILELGQAALMIALTGKSPPARAAVMRAYGLGAKVGVTLPYSRKHEAEADKIGLILMAKAGYDPRAAVDFWRRMAEASKGAARPELLSTHPSDEARIKKIEEFIPEAMEHYKKAIAENPEFERPPQPVSLFQPPLAPQMPGRPFTPPQHDFAQPGGPPGFPAP